MSKSVIIIGCGIAGPVLAMLLKHKGFNPVIYERQQEVSQGGIALGVSPQTFKVLNILGLAEKVVALGVPMEETMTYSQLRGEVLSHSNGGAKILGWLGWPLLLISRPVYSEFLYKSAVERGIEVHFSKKLTGVHQEGGRVKAMFEDGTEAESDFLVGCDGLHSGVRDAVFGKVDVTYTGLVQIAGVAPIPEFFESWKPTGYQAYGDGAHFITARVNEKEMMWGTTMPQPTEAREDWRHVDFDTAREMIKSLPCASWEHGPKEVVAGATSVTKYGLYERPILDVWHKGRVVLVGDAAHPTSPHLGQGANQAMEDCYHLVRLLCKVEPLTDASLEAAFTEYERLRIPTVTKAVSQARKEGENRVMVGKEECEKRDELIKEGGGVSPEAMKLRMELIQGPFMGQSEI